MRPVFLVVVLVALTSRAQAPLPAVTPFPLQINRTPESYGEKQRRRLSLEFLRALSKAAMVPDKARLDAALSALKRQDCDRENECLSQLALYAQTLYACFASVDLSYDRKTVTVKAKVVRDDNIQIGDWEVITVPIGAKESFDEVAEQALARIVERLIVTRKLDPSRTKLPPVTPPKPPPDVGQPPPPPPIVYQPIESRAAPMRIAGWVGVGVGAAAAVTGGVLIAASPTVRKDASGNIFAADKAAFQQARPQQAAGVGLIVGGVAVAALGATAVLIFHDAQTVRASVVPTAGGAAFVVGGGF